MSTQYLEAVCRENQDVNPLFSFLQARVARVENGEAEIILPVSVNLRQGGGMVAGGIMATIADEAMAHAVLSTLEEEQGAVTAEMNIRYLREADPCKGGELLAKARVVKRGRSLCFVEAIVEDASKRLLATAGGTFYIVRGSVQSVPVPFGGPVPRTGTSETV